VGAARSLIVAIAAVALLASCASPAQHAAPTTNDEAALSRAVDALVEPLVAASQFSGAVALMRDGRLVHARGWGLANHASGVAFTPDTPSDGGSLAKTFTAAGLWRLVHEGRLAMDQPVRTIVPEYPHGGVSVGQLLTHSNGLVLDYDAFDAHFRPGEARHTAALLTIAGRMAPAPSFPPGSRFEYANLAYDAAGLVIERISGQRYEAFVRERFFRPHGLVHSFARPAHFADWPVPRARGYRFREGRWQDHDAYDDEAFLGGSNLIFSATDLARWGQAWALARVLPEAAERAGRQAPLIAGRPSAINGLSWYCDGAGRRCHYSGSLNGFHALVYWDRDRRESVAFTSNSAIPAWPLIALQRALVDLMAGRPATAPDPLTAELKTVERSARGAVAGRYRLPGMGTATLAVAGERLQLQIDDGLVYDAHPVSKQVFYVPGTDWWLAFSDTTKSMVSGVQRVSSPNLHLRGMYHDAQAPRLLP